MSRKILWVASAMLLAGLASYALQPSAPRSAPNGATDEAMVTVTVPPLPGVAKEGETLFTDNCSTCHGVNAAGRDGVGPPLIHKYYEPNHHADFAFYSAVANGVRAHHWRFGDMPPIEGVTQDDMTKIIAYIRTLQQANGI